MHVDFAELQAGLPDIHRAPKDRGRVELIVRRPAEGEREILGEGALSVHEGLVGDTWSTRRCRLTPDGSPHPDLQLTLMNSRAVALIAATPDRRQLAGDQLFVDFDLSVENLPAGTHLAVGTAVIEVTDQPHRGCGKFASRFGVDALRFVNSDIGRELNLRGVNAKVITDGIVRQGDVVEKIDPR